MSTIVCPLCGSPVPLRRFFERANKPFCPRCGWNLDRSEAALDRRKGIVKVLALVFGGMGLFVFFAASRVGEPSTLVFPAMVVLIALVPLWSYLSTRKAIASAKSTVLPSLAQAHPPLDSSLQLLQSLPRPRRVRLRFPGTLTFLILALLVFALVEAFALADMGWKNFPKDAAGISLLLPFLIVVFVFGIMVVPSLYGEKRNLPLLRDGEFAFGRVLSQHMVQQRKSSYSQIDYEFLANNGQHVRNSQEDLTGRVFEDMTIAVFYDLVDPSRNTALCASYLKIAPSR